MASEITEEDDIFYGRYDFAAYSPPKETAASLFSTRVVTSTRRRPLSPSHSASTPTSFGSPSASRGTATHGLFTTRGTDTPRVPTPPHSPETFSSALGPRVFRCIVVGAGVGTILSVIYTASPLSSSYDTTVRWAAAAVISVITMAVMLWSWMSEPSPTQ